ncbi:FAD-dependent oxidoreductase [Microbacterium neungamense]|uniref:FAD-dependent oxidoreductase n=1 Tax=Microbacterium neungamense TaxID=2810535 RepID=UPI00217E95BB|nr:FAD-dependent monooxygenase [Microbacterium neungamense]UWF76795.1 FAD-dependent monooxygenase [Microbacterium neungamense]
MPDHDVIVAGGGPVGLLLGCLLAARGIDAIVCERRDGPDPRTRAIGIHPPGLAALAEAGLADAIRAEALALRGGEVLSRGRVLAAVAFGAGSGAGLRSGVGSGPGSGRPVLTLPQHRTDALLRARLAELSGGLRPGTEVLSVRDEGSRVRVAVRERGRERELTAALLVAADGVRSGIRTALGLGWRRRPGSAGYAMADVPDAGAGVRSGPDAGSDAVARLHCEPGGLVESLPLPGGIRRWVVRRTGPGSLADAAAFRAEIAARLGTDPGIPEDARPVEFLAAQHRAGRIATGRIALLGDAAHEISPIGGQGMNLGWADARRLAAAIEEALRSGRPDLERYARASVRAAASAHRRSAFYMAMGAPASGPLLTARETLIRALGAPRCGRAPPPS